MATAAEIAQVRLNTNEPTEDPYTDAVVGDLIDAYGVISASARIWRLKAAVYADLVDSSEAGASHKYGDLYKHALEMADFYEGLIPPPVGDRVKVRKIVRS